MKLRIRFIEPNFTRENPSTNGLVEVVHELVLQGWSVEVFSNQLDPSLVGKVSHRRTPRLHLPFTLTPWAYFCYYHCQGILDLFRRRAGADVVVSTGYMYMPADFATVHFSHFDFLVKIFRHGLFSPGLLRALSRLSHGAPAEILFLWNPWKTRLLAVSNSVMDDMARFSAPWKTVHLLPNQVSSERYHPAYRAATRQKARHTHGFGDNEAILLFSSNGHHFRKGFHTAVDVIAELRLQRLRVKMLIVGGNPRTLRRIRKAALRRHKDFDEWAIFTGHTSTPEFHFSAADALFFPSLSEAFSLVEIEAAALGLPLYLTPHHGVEMILRDGENGKLLPWDRDGMVAILKNEICEGAMRFTNGAAGRALSKAAYFEAWMEQLEPFRRSAAPTDSSTKPRLMLIGHTYMIAINREKALQLTNHFEVRVCTCDSHGLQALGRGITDTNPPEHEAAYSLRRLTRWPRNKNSTRFGLRGLGDEMRNFRPNYVLVESEPWSLQRWQARWTAWRLAPKAKFAEFTWENVKRPGLKGMALTLLYRAAAATGDLLICGNRDARKLCLAAGFSPDRTMVAAQLGISLEGHPLARPLEKESWRMGLGWPATSKVIGFCGRLVEEKGLLDLVQAIQELHVKYPDLRLAMVGEGILRSRLEAFDPHGNWLKILPAIPHSEIPAFLNKLDVFILPSKPMLSFDGKVWEEQFGHVLIEAMACGVLTLGSDSGAIEEVLDDPEVTFRHNDVPDMTAKLCTWLGNDAKRIQKASQQRERCATRWTHAAVAKTYADFLKNG